MGDPSFDLNGGIVSLSWAEVPVGSSFRVRLYDFPDGSKQRSWNDDKYSKLYRTYEARMLRGCEVFGVDSETDIYIDIPLRSFLSAWSRACVIENLSRKYPDVRMADWCGEAEIDIERLTRKRMKISQVELTEGLE